MEEFHESEDHAVMARITARASRKVLFRTTSSRFLNGAMKRRPRVEANDVSTRHYQALITNEKELKPLSGMQNQ